MLKSLLNTEVTQAMEQVKGRREAVAILCRPSIENGSVESRYVDTIHHPYDIIGPYYVVGLGITMLHTRPEEGANKLSLALTLIPSGMNLDVDENDPVKLLIVLVVADSTSRIEATSQSARLFDNEKDIQAILTAKTTQDILSVIACY